MANLTRLTAVASAAWSLASAWDLGIVPGVNDTATCPVGTTTSVTDARVIGNPTTAGTCLTVNGELVIADGGSLTRHGAAFLGSSGVYRGRGGGVEVIDPGTTGTWPTWTFGAGAQFVLEQTTISKPFTARGATGLTYSASRGSWWRSGIPFNNLEINATGQYLDLQRLGGDRDNPVFYMGNSNLAAKHRFGVVRATSCGQVYRAEWAAAADRGASFDGLTVRSSWSPLSVACLELPSSPNTAVGSSTLKQYRVDRPIWANESRWVELIDGFIDVRPGAGAAVSPLVTNVNSTVETLDLFFWHHGDAGSGVADVLLPHSSGATGSVNYTRIVGTVRSAVVNLGAVRGGATAGTTRVSFLYQSFTGSGNPSQDCFAYNIPIAARTILMEGCIVLPDGIDKTKQSACLVSDLDNQTTTTLVVRHCTWATNRAQAGGEAAETGVKFGETQTVDLPLGRVHAYNNIAADPADANQAIVAQRIGTRNQFDVLSGTALGYNVVASPFAGNSGLGYHGGFSGAGTGVPLRSSGVCSGVGQQPTTDLQLTATAQLQFAKPFGYGLADYYAEMKGTTGTRAGDLDACIVEMFKLHDVDFDPRFAGATVEAALRGAVRPQNATLFGRVHPTLTPAGFNAPGAVPMEPPGVAIPANGAAAASGTAAVVAVPQYGLLTPAGSAAAQASLGASGLVAIEDAYVGQCLGVLDIDRVTARPWDTSAAIGEFEPTAEVLLAASSDNELQLSGVRDTGRPAGGLLRPASGLTATARVETLDGQPVAGATALPIVGAASAPGEWLLPIPVTVVSGMAAGRYRVVLQLALGTARLEAEVLVRVQRLGLRRPGLAGEVGAVRVRAGRTASRTTTPGAPVVPPPAAVPIAAGGAAAALGLVVVAPAAPDVPDPLDVELLASNFGTDLGTGRWTVAVPVLPRHAALTDAELLTVRLYRADTGAEVLSEPPVRLLGACGALHTKIEAAGAGGVGYVARFRQDGPERLPLTPTVAVPERVVWPRHAADLCDWGIVPGRITPRAPLVGLPPAWGQVEDDFPRRQALEVAKRAAERAAWIAAGAPARPAATAEVVAFMGRGSRAFAYDPWLIEGTDGARTGEAAGHRAMWEAIRALDLTARLYYDPNGGGSEPFQAFDWIPACYWLTGHADGEPGSGGPGNGGDGWRRRAAFYLGSAVMQSRLFLYDGAFDLAFNLGDSSDGGRRIAHTLRGYLLMLRLRLSHTEHGSLIGASYPYRWDETPQLALEALRARLVALGRTAGALRGSWGGTQVVSQTSTDPAITGRADYRPNTVLAVVFQVLFAQQILCDLEHEGAARGAPIAPATIAGMRQTVVDALDYYAPMCLARGLGVGGAASGWAYANPTDYPTSAFGEDTTPTPILNPFGLLPLLRAATWSGNTAFVTLADRLVRDHWDGNYGAQFPNPDLDGMNPTALKQKDETYGRFARALLERVLLG